MYQSLQPPPNAARRSFTPQLKPSPTLDCLSPAAHRIAHERYTLIAGILPFVADERLRTAAIQHISIERNISKQTLRHYLCLFLAFQNIAALAPVERDSARPISIDEKNMRWALNKFYYTKRRISLPAAYNLMLKEKYCDGQGSLLPHFPSIYGKLSMPTERNSKSNSM